MNGRRARTDPALNVDFDDLKAGFSLGKAAALADWAFRKEQREGAALVKKLGHLRRNQRYRRKNKAKVYSWCVAWRRANREGWLAAARAVNARQYRKHRKKRLAKQRAKYEAAAVAAGRPRPRSWVAHCRACGGVGHNRTTCERSRPGAQVV